MADWTLKGPFLLMDGADVLVQHADPAECCFTEVTDERSFLLVHRHNVLLQVVLLLESYL